MTTFPPPISYPHQPQNNFLLLKEIVNDPNLICENKGQSRVRMAMLFRTLKKLVLFLAQRQVGCGLTLELALF